jgi:hypothetical protein
VKALLVVVATVILAGACSPFCAAASTAPILGYWSFKGGVVQVRENGSRYDGVIVRRPTDGDCAEPDGYVLLKLSGSGSHYTGAEEWWESPGCDRRYSNTAVVDLNGNTAHLCSKDPFPGQADSECVDMERLKTLPSGS